MSDWTGPLWALAVGLALCLGVELLKAKRRSNKK